MSDCVGVAVDGIAGSVSNAADCIDTDLDRIETAFGDLGNASGSAKNAAEGDFSAMTAALVAFAGPAGLFIAEVIKQLVRLRRESNAARNGMESDMPATATAVTTASTSITADLADIVDGVTN